MGFYEDNVGTVLVLSGWGSVLPRTDPNLPLTRESKCDDSGGVFAHIARPLPIKSNETTPES